jgi:hypothetical protein
LSILRALAADLGPAADPPMTIILFLRCIKTPSYVIDYTDVSFHSSMQIRKRHHSRHRQYDWDKDVAAGGWSRIDLNQFQ